MSSCQSQPGRAHVKFEKIIYSSGRCNGTCPKLYLQIDSNGKIRAKREFYITKSKIDSSKSGKFGGALSKTEMAELKKILKEINYTRIIMPELNHVDLSMTTLIIYDNKKRHWFRFLEPLQEIKALTEMLLQIAKEKPLEKTNEIVEMEK